MAPARVWVTLTIFSAVLPVYGTRQVRKATGTNLAHMTQLFMTLVLGTVIGLAFSWQIGP